MHLEVGRGVKGSNKFPDKLCLHILSRQISSRTIPSKDCASFVLPSPSSLLLQHDCVIYLFFPSVLLYFSTDCRHSLSVCNLQFKHAWPRETFKKKKRIPFVFSFPFFRFECPVWVVSREIVFSSHSEDNQRLWAISGIAFSCRTDASHQSGWLGMHDNQETKFESKRQMTRDRKCTFLFGQQFMSGFLSSVICWTQFKSEYFLYLFNCMTLGRKTSIRGTLWVIDLWFLQLKELEAGDSITWVSLISLQTQVHKMLCRLLCRRECPYLFSKKHITLS